MVSYSEECIKSPSLVIHKGLFYFEYINRGSIKDTSFPYAIFNELPVPTFPNLTDSITKHVSIKALLHRTIYYGYCGQMNTKSSKINEIFYN